MQCEIQFKSTIKKSDWFWCVIFFLGIFVKEMFPDIGELSLYQDIGIVIALIGAIAMLVTNLHFRQLNIISIFFLVVIFALSGVAVFVANNVIQDYNNGHKTAIMTNCSTQKPLDQAKYYLEGEIDGKHYEFIIDFDMYDSLDGKLYVLDRETYEPKHTPIQITYYEKTKKLIDCTLIID